MRHNLLFSLQEKISTNKIYSSHWAEKSRILDDLKDAVYYTLVKDGAPKIQRFPIEMEWLFSFKGRKLDTINCSGIVKCIEDALVQAEVFPDDTPKYVNSHKIMVSDKLSKHPVTVQLIIKERKI